MNFFTKKVACLLLFMMTSVSVFAFPGDPDPGGDPPAPIDSNLYFLLLFGIAFMIYFYAKKKDLKA